MWYSTRRTWGRAPTPPQRKKHRRMRRQKNFDGGQAFAGFSLAVLLPLTLMAIIAMAIHQA